MQDRPSSSRQFAGLSRWAWFWLAYGGVYLLLWVARAFGLVSGIAVELVAAPICVNWLVLAGRWVLTGSPAPRGTQRN